MNPKYTKIMDKPTQVVHMRSTFLTRRVCDLAYVINPREDLTSDEDKVTCPNCLYQMTRSILEAL